MRLPPTGPKAGASRISSGMLVIPEEMYANNKYYVSTIPPSADFTVTIRNTLDNSTSVLTPLISRNQVNYEVRLKAGNYKFILQNKDGAEDDV